jgi:hypothetical protein
MITGKGLLIRLLKIKLWYETSVTTRSSAAFVNMQKTRPIKMCPRNQVGFVKRHIAVWIGLCTIPDRDCEHKTLFPKAEVVGIVKRSVYGG